MGFFENFPSPHVWKQTVIKNIGKGRNLPDPPSNSFAKKHVPPVQLFFFPEDEMGQL